MICPNCKNKIHKNSQKFCIYCGTKLDVVTNSKPQVKKFQQRHLIIVAIALILTIVTGICCFDTYEKQNIITFETVKTPTNILNKIDEVQAEYFEIIKRNDMFLMLEESEAKIKDKKDLKKLYKKVENSIAKNNYYLQKYYDIEKQYSTSSAKTTAEMYNFSNSYYTAIDNLLNEVYQKVRQAISKEDFKQLISSELKWLREVENYRKNYEQQEYGSIGTLIYYDYQIDMRKFRTLLLMLYL